MPQFRVSEAAALLGVSDDTVRRYIDTGVLNATPDASNRLVIDGLELAHYTQTVARAAEDPSKVARSARNKMVGLVTAVTTNGVMAQVEMQCGPHRMVSLLSAEAVADLGLQPGVIAVAVVKSTDVLVEVPDHSSGRIITRG